eukprot:13067556-Ditylum_brightwellii.AAC.1
MATLSHGFDQFVNHFEELKLPLEARRISPSQYELEGLLSAHAELIKGRFGSHIADVSPTALAASQRARQRQFEQEELERQAKRRKTRGDPADENLL